jgi:drug/metabolite transporter (DMT)-like permease
LSFSVSTVVGQKALEADVSAAMVAGVRLLVGASMLWCLVGVLSVGRDIALGRRLLLLASGCLTAVQVLLLFEAVDRLGSSLAILLLFSYPPMVAVIAVLTRRERPSWAKASAVAISLAGMVLVIGAPDSRVTVVGCAFGLGAGLALALYITSADRTASGVNPFAATAWIQLGALVAITPIVIWRDHDGFAAGLPWWTIVIGVASGLAALLFIMAVQRVTPTIASISSMVEPVATAALAVVLLDDQLSARQIAGGVLILVAVLTVSRAPAPSSGDRRTSTRASIG